MDFERDVSVRYRNVRNAQENELGEFLRVEERKTLHEQASPIVSHYDCFTDAEVIQEFLEVRGCFAVRVMGFLCFDFVLTRVRFARVVTAGVGSNNTVTKLCEVGNLVAPL